MSSEVLLAERNKQESAITNDDRLSPEEKGLKIGRLEALAAEPMTMLASKLRWNAATTKELSIRCRFTTGVALTVPKMENLKSARDGAHNIELSEKLDSITCWAKD